MTATMTSVDDLTTEYTRTAADRRAVAEGCRIDIARAERVRTFFSDFIQHSKGQWANEPFTLLDWQWRGVILPLFGWVNPDGTRRFRSGYISVAKKNGKSALMSGLGLYMLIGDREPGSECYCAASDREQATIVYRESANMVDSSPALKAILQTVRSTKTIAYVGGAGFLKAISSDAYRQEGLHIHFLSFDELHAQPKRDLWDTLKYGGAARRQPLQLAITTAGYDQHSICYEQYTYANHILDGTVDDPTFFAAIWEVDRDADWTDETLWEQANPSMGVTISREEMRAACAEAQESAVKENTFRRYRLNQWTEQSVRWLQMDRWDACVGDVDAESLRGCKCWAGLDMASTRDLTAFVLVFPMDNTFKVLPFFWVPEASARERSRRDRVEYLDWQREGFITLTPGNVLDQEYVRNAVVDLGKKFDIQEIALDPYNAGWIESKLIDDGFRVMQHRQGMLSMNEPTKHLERCVLSGRLEHGGHPVLRWNAKNTTVKTDAAGCLKPDKEKSTERIDGIVSLIMALGRAMGGDSGGSVYDDPNYWAAL